MAKTKRPPQTKKKTGGARIGEGGPRADKVAAVDAVKERLAGSGAALLTEYRGLTVSELADLRTQLRAAGADYKVVKNTLASIAVKDAGLDDLLPLLEGPVAWTFTGEDPVGAAKAITTFAKSAPALVLKGGVLEGRVLGPDDVKALSDVEPREVQLAKLAGGLITPLQKTANVFAAGFNMLGAALAQYREKLEKTEAA